MKPKVGGLSGGLSEELRTERMLLDGSSVAVRLRNSTGMLGPHPII